MRGLDKNWLVSYTWMRRALGNINQSLQHLTIEYYQFDGSTINSDGTASECRRPCPRELNTHGIKDVR